MVSASLVQFSFLTDSPVLTRNLHNILCFLNPLYPLMGCLNCITKVGWATTATSKTSSDSSCCTKQHSDVLSHLQATFLTDLYEENFLWKNLLIAVVAVCVSFEMI